MLGYWMTKCPVRTGRKDVLATVYRKAGQALVIVASWAPKSVSCRLAVDWEALGLDPKRAKLRAPKIPGVQTARRLDLGAGLPIEPGKGWMLILSEAPRGAPSPRR